MRKTIMTIGTAMLFTLGSFTFIGCSEEGDHHHDTEHHESDHHHEHDGDHAEHAHYQCPMDCEDGKTYEEPGECPVCKMDLEELKKE